MSQSAIDNGVTSTITKESRPQALQQAAVVLAAGGTVLIPEISLALRSRGDLLYCEVRDAEPLVHRCAVEYEVLVENCRRMLDSTAFAAYLPSLPRRWIVVDAGSSAPGTLWVAP